MLFCIFIYYPINVYPDDYPFIVDLFYMVFGRASFTIGFVCVIYPMLLGRGGFVAGALKLDIFTPLARLTFGAYSCAHYL